MSELTLFKDRRLSIPFSIEDLGDIEAGDVRTIDGYLYNSTPNNIVGITYETGDSDLRVFNIPSQLQSESWKKIEIKYSPSKERTEPLNTFVTFRGLRKIPPE